MSRRKVFLVAVAVSVALAGVLWIALPSGREVDRPPLTMEGSIAFVRAGPGIMMLPGEVGAATDPRIVIVDPATGRELEVLDLGERVSSPAWSPDGRWLAFSAAKIVADRPAVFSLFVVRPDGTDLRRLSTCRPPACMGDLEPAWSPSGDRIAFIRVWRKSQHVWVVDSEGGKPARIGGLRDLAVFSGPSWSPDGDRLVFAAYSRSRPLEMYVVGADGSGLTQLTHCGRPCESSAGAVWAPDGALIAFVRGSGGDGDLYVMRPDGTGVRRLTHCRPPGCQGEDSEPAWSPDGSALVFVRGEDFHGEDLYVVARTGGAPAQLTEGPPLESTPSWGVAATP